LFENFVPLSENSSPPLVSQAGYGPATNMHAEFRKYEKSGLNSNWWRLWTSISATWTHCT